MGVRRAVRAATAVAALSLAIGVAPTADAGTYPPKPPGVTVTLPVDADGNTYIEPNTTFSCTLCGFDQGDIAYVVVQTANPGTVVYESGPITVGANGCFTFTVTGGLPKGDYFALIEVDGQEFRIDLKVGTRIPPAGSDVAPLLRAGLLLVGTGVAIAVVAKRRRPAPVSTSA